MYWKRGLRSLGEAKKPSWARSHFTTNQVATEASNSSFYLPDKERVRSWIRVSFLHYMNNAM